MRNISFFIASVFLSWFLVVFVNGGTSGNNPALLASGNLVRGASVGEVLPSQVQGLSAKSAIVIEARSNRVIFERKAYDARPSASLAKIFSGIVAYEEYAPNARVRISQNAYLVNGSRFQKFKVGEIYTVDQLLHSLLIESNNTAAYALGSMMGQENFVAKMNEKAKLLGFKETSFFGPSGIDEEGSKTSAWEIAKAGEYLLYNEKLGEIMRKGTYMLYDAYGNFKRKIFTTNELWGVEGLVAAKTGFTDEALGNLLLIIEHPKKAGEFLISVVLGSEDRASDTLKLLNLIR